MNYNFTEFFQKNFPNISLENAEISPFGEGLINTSWKISYGNDEPKYFLQRLNTDVFTNFQAIENNLQVAKSYLESHDGIFLIFPISNKNGQFHTEFE